MKGFRHSYLGELLFRLPPAIRWLVAGCTLIWLAQLIAWSVYEPSYAWLLRWVALDRPFPWLWQLVSYAFIHDPLRIGHVLFNMFALWMFGSELERRWRWQSFLQFFLVCAVGGALANELIVWMLPRFDGPVLGASGGVLGILAAYGILFGNREIRAFFIFPMKAKHYVLFLVLLELLFAWSPERGVANFCHLGGMATAWIYLKQGYRIARFNPIDWAKSKIDSARRARKRARFDVIDEKQWDAWLEDDSKDETQH